MEERPDEQVRFDLTSALLVARRVGPLDIQLTSPDRPHGEARARVVAAQLLAQRGIWDSESYGPQF